MLFTFQCQPVLEWPRFSALVAILINGVQIPCQVDRYTTGFIQMVFHFRGIGSVRALSTERLRASQDSL